VGATSTLDDTNAIADYFAGLRANPMHPCDIEAPTANPSPLDIAKH
jgi:hypothetical protein